MPAKRKSQSTWNRPLVVIGCLVIVLVLFTVASRSTNNKIRTPTPSTSPIAQSHTFTSSPVMGSFTITIPEGFEVEEEFGTLKLISSKGEIRISQNGSNFDNLNDHIEHMEQSNRVSFVDETKYTLRELEAQKGFINKQKTIFIYSNFNVYSISSNNLDLYDSVDHLAQSFYLPDK